MRAISRCPSVGSTTYQPCPYKHGAGNIYKHCNPPLNTTGGGGEGGGCFPCFDTHPPPPHPHPHPTPPRLSCIVNLVLRTLFAVSSISGTRNSNRLRIADLVFIYTSMLMSRTCRYRGSVNAAQKFQFNTQKLQ